MKQLSIVSLGKTRYADAWELQKQIFSLRATNELPDMLLLTQHDPVYTLGKGADPNHLLASVEELKTKNVDLFQIDRGGDVTFHGPGQLVGYPIIDLHAHYLDIHRYLRELEEVIIRTLKEFAITSGREKEFTGVWVRNEKIAALGVKVSKWITMHGFALNVNTDLTYFERIIPCGIFHKGVTSMKEILNREVSLSEVEQKLIYQFASLFSYEIKNISFEELTALLHHHEAVA